MVTTCVVVWIEIGKTQMGIALAAVTTCVVVWIEIHGVNVGLGMGYSHHLRGGVD